MEISDNEKDKQFLSYFSYWEINQIWDRMFDFEKILQDNQTQGKKKLDL